MNPYQYVLLRYQLNASAGELVNVGILTWLPEERELRWRISRNYGRLSRFFATFNGDAYRKLIDRFQSRCRQVAERLRDPQGDLFKTPPSDLGQIAGMLKADDASVLQWSDVRAGIATDIEVRVERLWDEFIGRHSARCERERMDEAAVLQRVDEALGAGNLHARTEGEYEIKGTNYSHRFRYCWQNGGVQVLDAISLDLVEPVRIRDKANTWAGRLLCLSRDNKFEMTGVVAPPVSDSLKDAYDDALAILCEAPSMRCVVALSDIGQVPALIKRDLADGR